MGVDEVAVWLQSPTESYVDACRESPAIASSVVRARIPVSLREIAMHRPLFIPESVLTRISTDLRDLLVLLEDVKRRCFADDAGEFLRAQGASSSRIEVIRENCVGELTRYARPDVISSADGVKIVELNTGSELGAYHTAIINRALLEQPEFAAFAEVHKLRYTDPRDVLIDRLRAFAHSVVGTDDPVVALVEETDPERNAAPIARILEDRGLRVFRCDLGDLSSRQGKIVAHGTRPVDLALRYFFANHLTDGADDRRAAAMLTKAHLNGHTALFTTLDSALYESKANLALLHHPSIQATMTADELALVRRVVPRTLLLGAAHPFVSADERRSVLEECRERRPDFVLKPANAHSSQGVVLGAAKTDGEWGQALELAAAGDYIAQERVRPLVHRIVDPTTGETRHWHATVGVFCDDGNFAGARPTAEPSDHPGSFDWSAKRYGCVFTYT